MEKVRSEEGQLMEKVMWTEEGQLMEKVGETEEG